MTKKIALVFYDATCVLCDCAILWLIKNDVESLFYFSHVTSNTAQKQVFIVTTEAISVLTPEGEYLKSSQAVLYLLDKTKRFSLFCSLLKLLPLKILDVFYKILASNRYRWFGQYSNCKVPNKVIKSKFLDY
ncbi:DCC1-like thiol-disulfide oxidoreductase family protein [Flavobacteriaceae bacterium]|nr:DCC1-like thiol-disulfide oxidoreductase family protein [Flavobacteriaceae bacterium]